MSFSFGAKSTTLSTPLFGAPASTTPSLFGSTTTTTTAPSLFGSVTSTASAPSLFGTTTTTTATAPSLFTSTNTTTPSLFGAVTTSAPVVPSLFGTTPNTGVALTNGSGTNVGQTVVEKENIRESEVPKPICELVDLIKNKIKENKEISDEFASSSTDISIKVKNKLNEVQHKISKARTRSTECDQLSAVLLERAVKDLRLGDVATRVQESTSKNMHHSAYSQTLQHMIEAIHEYDAAVCRYQDIIEDLHIKMSEILSGKSLLTTADLKEHLMRFDTAFSTVAGHLFESNQKVEELKIQLSTNTSFLNERDPFVRRQEPPQSFSELRGRDSFPSQSTIVDLGKRLKPAQAAPAATGKGLFGASTGNSLFGSSSTVKPFSFASTTSGGTSFFSSLTTSTPSSSASLFPSLTSSTSIAKPTSLSFGSTLSNNSSGLLFSSKK